MFLLACLPNETPRIFYMVMVLLFFSALAFCAAHGLMAYSRMKAEKATLDWPY
jgi:hypothetical protein